MEKTSENQIVFETKRLSIRLSTEEDWRLFDSLWNNGEVMKFVGFPLGLQQPVESIREQLANQSGDEYDRRLVVVLKATGEELGECKLGRPDENGLSETDVKLLPQYWGNGYGVEIKRALVQYLFEHSDCKIVQASPNKKNSASIKMQEAVGGVCVDERLYEFPEHLQDVRENVHALIYHVSRETFIP